MKSSLLLIKKILWFLFKSPQRKAGLLSSLLTEIRGSIAITFHSTSQLKPISICTGIKNRSRNYLDFVLASVLQMEHQELIELSVFDCGSEEKEQLEKTIRERWKGKLVFHSEDYPFERSWSFNKAIAQANNELVFASDADMQLPQDLVEQCNKYITKNTVWFPVCFHLFKDKSAVISKEYGAWRFSGKGMFASTKNQFIEAGMYDEKFKQWGEEDWDLWLKFYKTGYYPYRNKCIGLFHHYHPTAEGAQEFKG